MNDKLVGVEPRGGSVNVCLVGADDDDDGDDDIMHNCSFFH